MLDAILSAADNEGLRIGLIATTLGFGLRHGIDWDHIAAITDITSSQDLSRTSMIFATLYALGHGAVVFCLGVVAILLGDLLPDSVDGFMGRIVGVTLIILGVYVVYSLVKHGRDFRMRSRWMLIFSGVRHGTAGSDRGSAHAQVASRRVTYRWNTSTSTSPAHPTTRTWRPSPKRRPLSSLASTRTPTSTSTATRS